jgi:hypothetical protein
VDRRAKPGDDDYRRAKPDLSAVMPALGAGIHVLFSCGG